MNNPITCWVAYYLARYIIRFIHCRLSSIGMQSFTWRAKELWQLRLCRAGGQGRARGRLRLALSILAIVINLSRVTMAPCSCRYHSRSFVRVGLETTYASRGNYNFFTVWIMLFWILQSLRSSFIVLIGLMMTWYSEKMMAFTRCICGFMLSLNKKSWMVS